MKRLAHNPNEEKRHSETSRDSTMSSGKKSGASKPPVASYDDKRKGLRQATMAKDKTSDTLSLVIPAATAPVGAS